MSRNTGQNRQNHPAITRARREGFLRVRSYRVGASIHSRWWWECQEADHVFVLLVEKRTCSRLIVDTHTRAGIVSLADRIVRDVEDWAGQQFGKRWPSGSIIGDTAIDLDHLDPDDAAEYAADLAHVINTYPEVNTVDDGGPWEPAARSRKGRGGRRPFAHLAQRKADVSNEPERRVQ